MTPEMRTRSPAFSDSTSASVSGVRTSLMSSAEPVVTASLPARRLRSQRDLFVSVRVALDGDGDGERGDVAGVREEVDAERRGVAAVALRPDAQPVGAREQLLLQRVQGRIRVGRAELAEERLLGQDRG